MLIKHKDGMTYELFLVAGLETGVTVYAGVWFWFVKSLDELGWEVDGDCEGPVSFSLQTAFYYNMLMEEILSCYLI